MPVFDALMGKSRESTAKYPMFHPVTSRMAWYSDTTLFSVKWPAIRFVRKTYAAFVGWRSGAHSPNVVGSDWTTDT